MFGLGMPEILLISLIVLLLFGGAKIPELMRGLGKGVRNFKEGMNEVERSVNEPLREQEKKKEEDTESVKKTDKSVK